MILDDRDLFAIGVCNVSKFWGSKEATGKNVGLLSRFSEVTTGAAKAMFSYTFVCE